MRGMLPIGMSSVEQESLFSGPSSLCTAWMNGGCGPEKPAVVGFTAGTCGGAILVEGSSARMPGVEFTHDPVAALLVLLHCWLCVSGVCASWIDAERCCCTAGPAESEVWTCGLVL